MRCNVLSICMLYVHCTELTQPTEVPFCSCKDTYLHTLWPPGQPYPSGSQILPTFLDCFDPRGFHTLVAQINSTETLCLMSVMLVVSIHVTMAKQKSFSIFY